MLALTQEGSDVRTQETYELSPPTATKNMSPGLYTLNSGRKPYHDKESSEMFDSHDGVLHSF